VPNLSRLSVKLLILPFLLLSRVTNDSQGVNKGAYHLLGIHLWQKKHANSRSKPNLERSELSGRIISTTMEKFHGSAPGSACGKKKISLRISTQCAAKKRAQYGGACSPLHFAKGKEVTSREVHTEPLLRLHLGTA